MDVLKSMLIVTTLESVKNVCLIVLLLVCLVSIFPVTVSATDGLIPPNSKIYFLQSWGESIQLWLTFSKEQKIEYLFKLTERRMSEFNNTPTSAVANRYEDHYRQLGVLSAQVPDKEQVTERIKTSSLNQQQVLSSVYARVPQQAQTAILKAQENSSKHVANTIGVIEGSAEAQVYTQQAAAIQLVERMGQVEQVPMEGSPNGDPSQFTPRALKGTNQANPINPGSADEAGQMQPVQPLQMNQPPVQN